MAFATKLELIESPYLPADIRTKVEQGGDLAFELELASELVAEAIINDRYEVADGGELPTDPVKRAAVKNATLRQVAYWSILGVSVGRGASGQPRRAASASINGASVTWDQNSAAGAEREVAGSALPTLCDPALGILRRSGMATLKVRGSRW